MAFYEILLQLLLLINVPPAFCAESNGQKAHFQVEDKSGDLKVIATKDEAKVTAQADSVQVVVDPGTADYPVVKSDKPVVHVSGPVCCNGGWTTYSVRKKSALPSTERGRISFSRRRKGKVPVVNKDDAMLEKKNSLPFPSGIYSTKAGALKVGLEARGKGRQRSKLVRMLGRAENQKLNSPIANSPHTESQKTKESVGSSVVGNKRETSHKVQLARNPTKNFLQTSLHESTFREIQGTKKTEVKGTGPSFHVTGNAGKIKMHVTKNATELTSESGGVDVLLKPSASGSSDKAEAQARSTQVVHLATEQGGDFEGLGIKKSILSHVGQKQG